MSFTSFFCLTPLGLECSRSRNTASFLTSHRLKKYKNLHPRSFMNGAKKTITLLYSSTFYSLFLPFFVLEIFKFKYGTVFIRYSASISKFEWFKQLWHGINIQKQFKIDLLDRSQPDVKKLLTESFLKSYLER